MKAITNTWNSFSEIVKAKPWLLFALISLFFYLILPNTNKRSSLMRDVYQLAPSEVRVELSKFEPEVDKLICSIALAVVMVANIRIVQSLRQSSIED
jgi:hypothetical protein